MEDLGFRVEGLVVQTGVPGTGDSFFGGSSVAGYRILGLGSLAASYIFPVQGYTRGCR